MKAQMWRKYMQEHVVAHLPGGWTATRGIVYHKPVEWVLSCISLANFHNANGAVFEISAVAQLLTTPKRFLHGPHLYRLGRGTPRGLWETDAVMAQPEPAMREMLDLIRDEALPRFEQLGTLDGYAEAALQLSAANPLDSNMHEELLTIRLLQGDLAAAVAINETIQRAPALDGRDWIVQLAARTDGLVSTAQRDMDEARNALRRTADTVCHALGVRR
jgi:hypothetical protein